MPLIPSARMAALARRDQLYGWRWKKHVRPARLRANPLCAICLKQGRVTAATVVDHVVAHKLDPDLFWNGELQSLCARCHDSVKQKEERSGRITIRCDVNGKPIET